MSCRFSLVVTNGDRAIFARYTAVTKDLPGGKMYSGAHKLERSKKKIKEMRFILMYQD